LSGTECSPCWLETSQRPAATAGLHGHVGADLLVVGGGYTGLWTALQAKERDPQREVVLIEGQRIGWAASGRNGGFCEYSLVHGDSNGENHLPEENARLTKLGMQNLAEFQEAIARYSMDVELETDGALIVATEAHQIQWLREEDSNFLDAEATRKLIKSTGFLAGSRDYSGSVLVNPAKLVWELARVCRELGVTIYEYTQAKEIVDKKNHIELLSPAGQVNAQYVALATNVFPS